MALANEMEEKTTLAFDEWTLDFTGHLHHTTQTRRSPMPKATGHALITFCNSSCHFFRSFTIVCLPNFCQSSATFSSHALGEKTRPNVHKPKHSIDNTPAPNIVHIGTTPWSHSRQPPPSSQTTKPYRIHYFRPVLPSSFCISLRPARRAVSSRRNPMSKDRFLT